LARLNFSPQLQGKLDPSDIVQETLLEARQQLAQFKGQTDEEMAGWLRRILTHNLADAVRRYATDRRDVVLEESLEAAVEQSASGLQAWLVDGDPSPRSQAERAELLLLVVEALNQLPDDQRRAVEQKYLQGQSVAAISGQMGRTQAAVAGLLRRGLQALREKLAERFE
jgi:RNA polymerase sigma-70 factor (ECF subfamily)